MLSGAEIQAKREALGLTRSDLGRRAHRSEMTVWNVEHGRPARESTLLAIAVALAAAEHPANLPPAA